MFFPIHSSPYSLILNIVPLYNIKELFTEILNSMRSGEALLIV